MAPVLAPVLLALQPVPIDAPFNDAAYFGASTSVCVRDMDGNVLFERDSTRRLLPASNQKLFTCAFALHTLGPNHRPQTRIWKTPSRTIVESNGDPLLTYARLQEVVTRLQLDRRLPVHLKQSYAPYWPPSWELDDLPNKYASPVTAFTVDRGSFALWAEGGRPKLEPTTYGTRISWNAASPETSFSYDPMRREVTVKGPLPKERTRLDTLSLPRPDEAAASLLGTALVHTENVPKEPPSAIIEGNTIAEAVAACMPPSDNNIAENLLMMGAQRYESLKADPYPKARGYMQSFLTRVVGLPSTDLRVYDGSGMSRHNLATTRAMSQFLVWAVRQPYATQWRDALARPGVGTLRERLQGVQFTGKTGSLDFVVSLSGYVRAKSGKEVAVSIIMNNFAPTATEARVALDQVTRNIADAY